MRMVLEFVMMSIAVSLVILGIMVFIFEDKENRE